MFFVPVMYDSNPDARFDLSKEQVKGLKSLYVYIFGNDWKYELAILFALLGGHMARMFLSSKEEEFIEGSVVFMYGFKELFIPWANRLLLKPEVKAKVTHIMLLVLEIKFGDLWPTKIAEFTSNYWVPTKSAVLEVSVQETFLHEVAELVQRYPIEFIEWMANTPGNKPE